MVTGKQNIGERVAVNGRRRSLIVAGSGLIASGLLRPARAQSQAWPSKPIKLVAAQAPGSSNDASARAFADYFTSRLGVSVVVENKPGGLGMIAAESVARATDGHTFLITLHSQLAQAPVLLKKPPIDPSKDLVPIGAIGVGPVIAAVNKDLPVRNLAEFIDLARKRPVSVGNYAIGSGWQLMLAKLVKDHGLQFNVANYRGTGAMLMDLYGGQIEAGAGSLSGLGAGVQNGSIRPMVIIIGSRSSRLPGIPTWVEAGFKGPAFEDLAECNMLLGPSGTPSDVVDRLGSLIQESVKDSPRVRAVRDTLAADDVPLTGAALQQFIRKTWPSYQALTREMDFKLE